jgi:hypothetical protein
MYFKWKLVSVRLLVVLVSAQNRCMVCAERTIGSENHFGCTHGTPTRHGSSGNSL